jgi:hypothetical protein
VYGRSSSAERFAQPWRGRRSGEMPRQSFSKRNWTLSPSPHCLMRSFGMRTPRELPIRTSSVLYCGICGVFLYGVVRSSRMSHE